MYQSHNIPNMCWSSFVFIIMHMFSPFQDMRKGFEQESAATRKPTLLLTAAVPAGKSYIDGGYDIPLIMRYVFTGVCLLTGG